MVKKIVVLTFVSAFVVVGLAGCGEEKKAEPAKEPAKTEAPK
jgi:hypothetical protein